MAELEALEAEATEALKGPAGGGVTTSASKLTVTDQGNGGFSIYHSEGGLIEGSFDVVTGELHVDWISTSKKGKLIGTELYEAAFEEASRRGKVEAITGEMEIDNAQALEKSGGDVNAMPSAKIRNNLGFTKHEYDSQTHVLRSTRPKGD